MKQVPGKTPDKPFEVVIATEGEPDEVKRWGSDLVSLLPDYIHAKQDAKIATKKDKKKRWVSVRQIIALEAIQ